MRILAAVGLTWWLCTGAFTLVAAAEEPVEILYVHGCTESSPQARETTQCFGGNAITLVKNVELSLRGVHFPLLDEAYRVLLKEHQEIPPLLLATEGKDEVVAGDGAYSASESALQLQMECAAPTASSFFPSQLITCDLENPLHYFGAPEHIAELERLKKAPMWFDVLLQRRRKDGKEVAYETVAVMRRAVEVAVDQLSRNRTAQRTQRILSPEELRQHPLERLYSPSLKPTRLTDTQHIDAGDNGGAESGEDDVWVELGIGGLKQELRSLFRRVFLSRLPSLAPLADALELQHVRGVILYGPPGNGKTLIARSLFRLLGPNARLTVVNAADILSKFVGESEKNLKDIFEGYAVGTSSRAEDALKDGHSFAHAEAHSSPTTVELHVLVIDEFEALFRRRGFSGDESSAKAVYDGITNSLLSLMDGIKSRNDLLVVGLTNRLHSIDTALLRPGRFEVLVEIPSPDIPGREEIFFIHTDRLREKGFLSPEVDLHDLALRSGGFSGSDIAGVARSAVSHALLRHRRSALDMTSPRRATPSEACSATMSRDDLQNPDFSCSSSGATAFASDGGAGVGDGSMPFMVTKADFDRAMADIRSAKDELSAVSQVPSDGEGGESQIHDYNGVLGRNLETANSSIHVIMESNRTMAGMIAIDGASGTGKTTLSREIVNLYPFTVVRFVSCRRLVELQGYGEQLAAIRDALNEASHTPSGLVVLDDYDVFVNVIGKQAYYSSALQGLLYDFMHHPHGVKSTPLSQSSLEAGEYGGESHGSSATMMNAGAQVAATRNRRVIVVTSSSTALISELSYDIHLRIAPISRQGVESLLNLYHVASHDHSQAISFSYPSMISYRNFLRVTDKALQLWVKWSTEKKRSPDTFPPTLPAFFTTSDATQASYADRYASEVAEAFFSVKSPEAATAFANAVRSVVEGMGLSDPYKNWGTFDDFEGDPEEKNSGDSEFDGESDELLW